MLEALASSLVLAGLSTPVVALLATRDARPGLGMMLDLWTASALLYLLTEASWLTLTVVAALVLARSVAQRRLSAAAR